MYFNNFFYRFELNIFFIFQHCQEGKCPVPFCSNIKHKLKQQQLQQRLQQAQLLRRRMAVMSRQTQPQSAAPMPGAGGGQNAGQVQMGGVQGNMNAAGK